MKKTIHEEVINGVRFMLREDGSVSNSRHLRDSIGDLTIDEKGASRNADAGPFTAEIYDQARAFRNRNLHRLSPLKEWEERDDDGAIGVMGIEDGALIIEYPNRRIRVGFPTSTSTDERRLRFFDKYSAQLQRLYPEVPAREKAALVVEGEIVFFHWKRLGWMPFVHCFDGKGKHCEFPGGNSIVQDRAKKWGILNMPPDIRFDIPTNAFFFHNELEDEQRSNALFRRALAGALRVPTETSPDRLLRYVEKLESDVRRYRDELGIPNIESIELTIGIAEPKPVPAPAELDLDAERKLVCEGHTKNALEYLDEIERLRKALAAVESGAKPTPEGGDYLHAP